MNFRVEANSRRLIFSFHVIFMRLFFFCYGNRNAIFVSRYKEFSGVF